MQLQTAAQPQNSITKYDNQSVTIQQQTYNESVLITSESVSPISVANNKIELLTELAQLNLPTLAFEHLIIGGVELSPISIHPEFMLDCFKQSISVEGMSLGGACRTFNIMLSEGRSVAFLLKL